MRTTKKNYVIEKDGQTLPTRSKLSFDNMTDYIAENGNSTEELQTFVDTYHENGIVEAREYFLKKYFADEYDLWEKNYLQQRSDKAKEAKQKRQAKKLDEKFAKLRNKESAKDE